MRFCNPTYGKFLVFSELGSPNDIENSAILIVPVFLVTFCIGSNCMPKIYILLGVNPIRTRGKIVLHLLFGWSLDKDQKSLDQSKQISWQFGKIQTKAFPNPDQPPLEFFWYINTSVPNIKLKTVKVAGNSTIKEFNRERCIEKKEKN